MNNVFAVVLVMMMIASSVGIVMLSLYSTIRSFEYARYVMMILCIVFVLSVIGLNKIH
jgi:hypothetical protein